MDRQSIERQDFSQSRKGYDPDEVDAHLSALAAQVEELKNSQPAASSSTSVSYTHLTLPTTPYV